MSRAQTGSSAASSKGAGAASARSRFGPSTKRIAEIELTLAGGILSLISGFTPWWTLSGDYGLGLTFLPGSTMQSSNQTATTSTSYTTAGFGPVGGVYEAMFLLLILGGLLSLISWFLGIRALYGRSTIASTRLASMVAISAALIVLVAFLLAPSVQPTAFRDSPGSACVTFTGESPCTSFWGSGSAGPRGLTVTDTFGPAIGWFLAGGAFALVLTRLILMRRGNAGPESNALPASTPQAPR
jgi:hypothetical protein